MMAARWPPNRCSTNICTSPAERVGKMAEWILFLHINTRARLSVVYCDVHACLCILNSSFFASAQEYSGLAHCFFCAETVGLNRIHKQQRNMLPNARQKTICSERLEN